MFYKYLVFVLSLCLFFTPEKASAENGKWKDVSEGIFGKIRCIEGVRGQDVFYAGTENGLYITLNSGILWERAGFFKGINNIQNIAVTPLNIFVVCGSGFYVKRAGNDWEQLDGRRDLMGLAVFQKEGKEPFVFVWSGKKLFLIKGKIRERITSGVMWDDDIDDVACRGGKVFVASAGRVYFSSDEGKSWKKIFLFSEYCEKEKEESPAYEHEEEMGRELSAIRDIDSSGPEGITVSTVWGIFIISDEGRVIKRIRTKDIASGHVLCTAHAGGELFAATDKRIFRYSEERDMWCSVFDKAFSGSISSLKAHSDGKGRTRLWVAAGRHIYKEAKGKPGTEQVRSGVNDRFSGARQTGGIQEVSMREVHRMAIEYAEVSPEKIKRWRKGAKWKAIVPRISIGFSESFDDNVDIYKSSTTSYVVKGPRERGNDWGVDLTWELSDLVWNDAQTNIDVRSKLMVQLRDDILEEVTQLYFARKRLLLEIDRMAQNRNGTDLAGDLPAEFLDKKIRVEELTAYIDAFTGGRFSEALRLSGRK